MFNRNQKVMDELREIFKKHNLTNTDIRILWEESDAFVSNFMTGKTKNLNFGKLLSLLHNVKQKELFALHSDISQLIINSVNEN